MHFAKSLPALFLVALTLCQIAFAAPAKRTIPHPASVQPSVEIIRVGTLDLHRCRYLPAYCGSLDRPLDPAGKVAGTIRIGFAYYPRRDQSSPALGNIVATEGGPGYSTIGSADGYVGLYYPLMDHRNLLLVDNRGTGRSQPIDCEPLQSFPFLSLPRIKTCGDYLGDTSDLYGSGLAADDMAAILDALGIDKIDLYGDSYGTFFSQSFAGRHPDRLRSLVLDSAWPVVGQNPWYPEAPVAMRHAFEAACERSLVCRDVPGAASERFERLLQSLRQHPFSGKTHNGDGTPVTTLANPTALAFAAYSQSTGPNVYRETDAAARAYLDHGDSAPLLRLFAENYGVANSGAGDNQTTEYSAGLFIAVSCTDYGQLYDMTAPVSVRAMQRNAAFAAEEADDPSLYSPFTIPEFNSIPLDYSVFDSCLNWPVPSPAHPPGQPAGANPRFTTAPVLVLSGEMDTLTPTGQGTKAADLFQNATHVVVNNSTHVTAVGDQFNCASVIVVRFVSTLDPGDTSCAANIPEIRTVPRFAKSAAELDPARSREGNAGTEKDLRITAAAVQSAGDVLARWWVNYSGSGVGLRGGTFVSSGHGNLTTFHLKNYRWTNDVAVTGTVTWNYATGWVHANLQVTGPDGESGSLTMSWPGSKVHAMATISGEISGRTIAATTYAP